MTTQPRERDEQRARKARRRRATPPESNEHAVRLVDQRAAETETEAGEISPVAHQLGFGAESHRSGSRGRPLRSSIPG